MWSAYIPDRSNKSLINLSEIIKKISTTILSSWSTKKFTRIWFFISNISLKIYNWYASFKNSWGSLSQPLAELDRFQDGFICLDYPRHIRTAASRHASSLLWGWCPWECFLTRASLSKACGFVCLQEHTCADNIFFPLYFQVVILKNSSNP